MAAKKRKKRKKGITLAQLNKKVDRSLQHAYRILGEHDEIINKLEAKAWK